VFGRSLVVASEPAVREFCRCRRPEGPFFFDMRFPQFMLLGHSRRVSGDDRSATGNAVGECESLSIREAVVGKQTIRQAARLAASEAYARRRRERDQRDRRLEKLAIEVLTALGERDATIAATEQRAGAALQAMITDESLTVSEAVQWCAGAISHREATRLRHLTAGTQQPRGLVGFRWFVTLKTQSAVPSGRACMQVVADVNTFPGWISRRIGQTSIVHTMIIFRCDQRGLRTWRS
jgi:hypothetical protein